MSDPEAEDPDFVDEHLQVLQERSSFEYSTLTLKAWHPRLTSYPLQSRSTFLSS